jgi:hypothetical protein
MDKKFIEAKLEKLADGKLEFVATDETLDRQGEVIPIDSWDLGNFKKNPVLLVNHDYKVQNIVGRAENLRFMDRGGKKMMTFEPVFHGITQLAREVEAMVRETILNTVSVGFMRRAPGQDGDKQLNELMEISFVPVPANPGAERIKSLIDPKLSTEDEKAVKDFAEQKEGRVISGKNRARMQEMIGMADESIGKLQSMREMMGTMMDETDPGKAVEDIKNNIDASEHGETKDTPILGKGKADKGRVEGNSRQIKILQRVAKEVNHALYQIKQK